MFQDNGELRIHKLLALNRGEIAIRILRAANELGIRTVAVFSQEDRLSLHRFKADEAYLIGEGRGPVQAYLEVDGIVALAAEKEVDAIHPGYGFLSENPALPRACERAGHFSLGFRLDLRREHTVEVCLAFRCIDRNSGLVVAHRLRLRIGVDAIIPFDIRIGRETDVDSGQFHASGIVLRQPVFHRHAARQRERARKHGKPRHSQHCLHERVPSPVVVPRGGSISSAPTDVYL